MMVSCILSVEKLSLLVLLLFFVVVWSSVAPRRDSLDRTITRVIFELF
jgi:hypothetical protein